MAKEFTEWVKDYNPNSVTLGPIVLAYLRRVYEHLDADDGIIEPLPHGVVSKYDVYLRTMGELSRIAKRKFPDGYLVQTGIMAEPLYSQWLETDDKMGVTEGGFHDQVRFIRHLKPDVIERMPEGVPHYKEVRKKAGGFLLELIDEIYPELPTEIKTWCCEMFAQKWSATNTYSEYELHVDNKFWKIYNPEWHDGDFGSCMAKAEWHGNWQFYINSVNASAAYISRRGSKKMVARCVVFNDVRCEETGEHFRYAERQYSTGKRENLKLALIELLKAHGYIDIHKVVGANFDDRQKIIDAFTGESLYGKTFSIDCSLINGDNVSYQDSFCCYSPREHRAYNKTHKGAHVNLATCSPWFYNESSQNSRPHANSGTWTADEFHRRYVDTREGTTTLHYIGPGDGRIHTSHCIDCRDTILCAGDELWLDEDTMEYDGRYYPKNMLVRSEVEHCMIPKDKAVLLHGGSDYCTQGNQIAFNGELYHKSDLVYSRICKEWTVKPWAFEIGGMWIPVPMYLWKEWNANPFGKNHLPARIKDETLQVMCSNGKWRDVNDAEWDGVEQGWYDAHDYVNAWYPVRAKTEDGQHKYELRQKRTRREKAWKCGVDGKWYHRYHIIKNLMTNEPMVRIPGIKFKGLINDAFLTMADWQNSHCPIRTGLDEDTYRKFESVRKALSKH